LKKEEATSALAAKLNTTDRAVIKKTVASDIKTIKKISIT
jgi:hypothetical protein